MAIVVYETTLNRNETVEMLRKKSKDDVLDFIRKRLSFDAAILGQLKHIDTEVMKREHRRFEMSGYESFPGQCTLHNLAIINEFAYLGIYDYTEYLSLDFYKGTPTLYLKYFGARENLEFSFSGLGTVDIIFEIFERTIFSDKAKRRR